MGPRVTESQTFPPYEQGHFDVSNGHRLYYERYGRSGGLPVLFVHGGPRAGFSEDDKAFFDPEVRLQFVCAGHSASEDAIKETLVAELGRFAELLG